MATFTANVNTTNAQEYLNSLNKYLQKDLSKALVREQMEIMLVYQNAYLDTINKGLEKAGGDPKKIDKLTLAYSQQIYEQLETVVKENNSRVANKIADLQAQIVQECLGDKATQDFIEQVKQSVDVTSREMVEQIIKGNIYYDGKGLDKRLWEASKTSAYKIKQAIASCMAEGMGAAEMSEVLKEFATGGHHTWSRNKIREKLGPGYARKYSGGLDYEALRLARTTLTHQAQISVLDGKRVNPYMQFVKWHSSHDAGRTCDLCNDRDGKIFKLDEVPLDHPNGACWLQPVYSLDGKTECTLEDIAKDMRNWATGEDNSGLMDTIEEYKGLGGTAKKKTASIKDAVQAYLQARKDGTVTDEVRQRARTQITETISKRVQSLQKDYSYVTENEVRTLKNLLGVPEKSDLSRADRDVYESYVQKGDSFRINRRLYSGEYAKAKMKNSIDLKIDALTEFIGREELDKNSRFVRFVGNDYLNTVCNQLGATNTLNNDGMNPRKIDNNLLSLNADLMGKVITNDAFTSVSYDQQANVFTHKPIMMEIYADEGLPAYYTYNYHESEVILQRGTQFEIVGVEQVDDYDRWGDPTKYIKLIVKTVSKK